MILHSLHLKVSEMPGKAMSDHNHKNQINAGGTLVYIFGSVYPDAGFHNVTVSLGGAPSYACDVLTVASRVILCVTRAVAALDVTTAVRADVTVLVDGVTAACQSPAGCALTLDPRETLNLGVLNLGPATVLAGGDLTLRYDDIMVHASPPPGSTAPTVDFFAAPAEAGQFFIFFGVLLSVFVFLSDINSKFGLHL